MALERVLLVKVGYGHLLPVKFGGLSFSPEAPLSFLIQRKNGETALLLKTAIHVKNLASARPFPER